jgi:hypothetical protein
MPFGAQPFEICGSTDTRDRSDEIVERIMLAEEDDFSFTGYLDLQLIARLESRFGQRGHW